MGELKLYDRSNIVTTLSLFHLFGNRYYLEIPEK